MIVGSLLLILVAVVLLGVGVAHGSVPLLVGSISATLLAAVALIAGARQAPMPDSGTVGRITRRRRVVAGGPATVPGGPADTPAATGAPAAHRPVFRRVRVFADEQSAGIQPTAPPTAPGAPPVTPGEADPTAPGEPGPTAPGEFVPVESVPVESVPVESTGVPVASGAGGHDGAGLAGASAGVATAADHLPARADPGTGPAPEAVTGAVPTGTGEPPRAPAAGNAAVVTRLADGVTIAAATPQPAEGPPVPPDSGTDQPPGARAEAVVGVADGTSGTLDEAEVDPPDEPPALAMSAAERASVEAVDAEVMVVDGRPRYHIPGCAHLSGRPGEPLPVGEAISLGFTPCAWCAPNQRLLRQARRS